MNPQMNQTATSTYGPWLVQCGTLKGKYWECGCFQVDAGSASEARRKARESGFGEIGRAQALYLREGKRGR